MIMMDGLGNSQPDIITVYQRTSKSSKIYFGMVELQVQYLHATCTKYRTLLPVRTVVVVFSGVVVLFFVVRCTKR